ncbi:MAG TPA: TonB-dependent receptor [Polyangiaceae bacterium]|nr:TonB-dependent receptor [Polyangiaceae bacterium]
MLSRSVRAKFASVVTFLLVSPAFAQPTDPADDEAMADEIPEDEGEPAKKEEAPEEPADAEEGMDDEALAEEDAALLEEMEASTSKPIPKGQGAVIGRVTDTKFNEPVIEGNVSALGTKFRTLTDLEGNFRLDLPPGTYTLRFSYELHRSTRVEGVIITEGKMVRADAQLTPDESAVDVVEVVADVDRSSLEGQTLRRQRDAAVGDGVGRAEIARTPDRNAAEAARRVVGASIVGGRFVYVRGLGERYTNASLNGSPLPSPEPDRNTVPLDLFPSLIIDSITIAKSFTPDMPADFAGGSVRIYTRQFPRETLFQVSLSAGFNTETTFQEGLGYEGSSTDWLGFDGGTRQLPDSVPDALVADDTVVNGQELGQNGVLAIGRDVNSYMTTRPETMPPNHGLSIVAGDAFKLGESQKLGAIVALNYGRSYETTRDEVLRIYGNPAPGTSELRPLTDAKADTTIDKVRWGAFASVAWEISPQHRLSLTGLHSQLADDEAMEIHGNFDGGSISGPGHATSLSYVSRSLDVAQLRGEHDFPSLLNARLDWFGSLSRAGRDQPDTRSTLYALNDGDPPFWFFTQGPQSGSHLFSNQSENTRSAGIDWTQPFSKAEDAAKVKLGGMITDRERDFNARLFVFEPQRRLTPDQRAFLQCDGTTYPLDCPDKLFVPDNIGPVLGFREGTTDNDEYTAGLKVYAGYVMADLDVMKDVRLVVGPRVEDTELFVKSVNPWLPTEPIESRIDATDVLPAASVHFKATKQAGARFAASRTLARPQLREMAPYLQIPYFGGYEVRGNPDLDITYITNLDARFEYFPTLREVLAFSVFAKHFVDPIEEVLVPTSGGAELSYQNAKSADMVGIELEARKSLEFASPVLTDFSLVANLTLVKSQVLLDQIGINTNAERPLSNQSPYVVNVALDYARQLSRTSARLLYNVYGPRVAQVGSNGLEDVYEQPRHVVDLSVSQGIGEHFEVKGTGSNLLFAPVRFTQDGPDPDGSGPREPKEYLITRYDPGATFTISAAYTY